MVLLQKIGLAVLVWLGLAVMGAITFGYWPKTWLDALGWVVVGPGLFLFVSWIGESLADRIKGPSWWQRAPTAVRILCMVLVFGSPLIAMLGYVVWNAANP